tara:strand:+ start:104 stop:694 length:591 start_codon:yes stop_codon:yes gene_type:complete
MADLSFASMKKLFEDNWGSKSSRSIIEVINTVYATNTILEYGKTANNNDEIAALEFGERAIKNRIPFLMIAYTQGLDGAIDHDIDSLQISEFTWLTNNNDGYILRQGWDVDTEPSGLYEDETLWTEEEVKEYFNAKALQINVVDDWALKGRELKMNVRQDFVMILYGDVLIPIPINFLVNFPLEKELRKRIRDTKA